MNIKSIMRKRWKEVKLFDFSLPLHEILQINEVVKLDKYTDFEVIIGFTKLFGTNPDIATWRTFFNNARHGVVVDLYGNIIMEVQDVKGRTIITMDEFYRRVENNEKAQKIAKQLTKRAIERNSPENKLTFDMTIKYNLTASLTDLCYSLIYDLTEELDRKNLSLVGSSGHRIKNLIYTAEKFKQACLSYSNTWFQHTKLPEEDTSDIITHVSDIVVYFTKKLINCICYSKSNIEKLEAFINSLEQAKIYKRVDRPDDMNLFEQ